MDPELKRKNEKWASSTLQQQKVATKSQGVPEVIHIMSLIREGTCVACCSTLTSVNGTH
jgi:hypothetical protein